METDAEEDIPLRPGDTGYKQELSLEISITNLDTANRTTSLPALTTLTELILLALEKNQPLSVRKNVFPHTLPPLTRTSISDPSHTECLELLKSKPKSRLTVQLKLRSLFTRTS